MEAVLAVHQGELARREAPSQMPRCDVTCTLEKALAEPYFEVLNGAKLIWLGSLIAHHPLVKARWGEWVHLFENDRVSVYLDSPEHSDWHDHGAADCYAGVYVASGHAKHEVYRPDQGGIFTQGAPAGRGFTLEPNTIHRTCSTWEEDPAFAVHCYSKCLQKTTLYRMEWADAAPGPVFPRFVRDHEWLAEPWEAQ